jgi:hypothetical protein
MYRKFHAIELMVLNILGGGGRFAKGREVLYPTCRVHLYTDTNILYTERGLCGLPSTTNILSPNV